MLQPLLPDGKRAAEQGKGRSLPGSGLSTPQLRPFWEKRIERVRAKVKHQEGFQFKLKQTRYYLLAGGSTSILPYFVEMEKRHTSTQDKDLTALFEIIQ